MAFALWIDDEVAWAEGTHEYRPMGYAVVAATGLFAARDFRPMRMPRSRHDAAFAGLFASLSDVNAHLRGTRERNERRRRLRDRVRLVS